MSELLEIKTLTVRYKTRDGLLTALDSVSLRISENEMLALVGESGCGKTTLGLSIVSLLPPASSEVVNGSVTYKGTNLLMLEEKRKKAYRGTEIAMIFQEPLTCLNPVYRVGDQMAEAIMVKRARKEGRGQMHGTVMQRVYDRRAAVDTRFLRRGHGLPAQLRDEIVEWLTLVRIGDPEQVLNRYPFELSGGMTQRVMIAMALSEEPSLLIADEPTTALDVTTQAQVLKLMAELMKRVNTSILLITHDLAVASQVADRVMVMYAGELAEVGEVHQVFAEPLHPYTKGLLGCIPTGTKDDSELAPIPGSIPDLRQLPLGCNFAPRCPYVFERCRSDRPHLFPREGGREVACFLYDE